MFSFGDGGWGDELAVGLAITLQLAVVTLPFGLILAALLCFCSLSRWVVVRLVSLWVSTVLRGLPEILTLFLIYNGIGLLLRRLSEVWGVEDQAWGISPFVAGVISLGLVFGAYASEVLRGAALALPRKEIEAAKAIGMTPILIWRRVIWPHIWRLALPGLGNLWTVLLKDTALVSIISVSDLMRVTRVAVGSTKQPFAFFIVACCLYWLVSLGSEWIFKRLEWRARTFQSHSSSRGAGSA